MMTVYTLRGRLTRLALVAGTVLCGVQAWSAKSGIDIRVAEPLPEMTSVNVVQGCIDSAGEQVAALVRQSLNRRGIRVTSDAPVILTVTSAPCNEFAFAEQGPRDLQDAPRGPLGSKIVTPINKSRKAPTVAGLRLVIRDARNKIFWDGRAQARVSETQSAPATVLNLVLPMLDAALSQRSNSQK